MVFIIVIPAKENVRFIRLRCNNVTYKDFIRICTADVYYLLRLNYIIFAAFLFFMECHIIYGLIFWSYVNIFIRRDACDFCFKRDLLIGICVCIAILGNLKPAQKGHAGQIRASDFFQNIIVLDDLLVYSLPCLVKECIARCCMIGLHFIQEVVCVSVSVSRIIHDNVNREVLGLELYVLVTDIHQLIGNLGCIAVIIDMQYRSVFNFLELVGHEFDRDPLQRLDRFSILILESYVDSLYSCGILAHFGLDCVLDLICADLLEESLSSLRQCSFWGFDIDLNAPGCSGEVLSRILEFRIFLDYLLFSLFCCRFFSHCAFRLFNIGRYCVSRIIRSIRLIRFRHSNIVLYRCRICCRFRIRCRCWFCRRFWIRCRRRFRFWIRCRCGFLCGSSHTGCFFISKCIH